MDNEDLDWESKSDEQFASFQPIVPLKKELIEEKLRPIETKNIAPAKQKKQFKKLAPKGTICQDCFEVENFGDVVNSKCRCNKKKLPGLSNYRY